MSFLIALYSAGLAQAVLLIAALSILKVRNGMARWLLVALIATFSLMLAEELADAAGHSPGIGLGLAIEFALGPLLYFLVRALYDPGRTTPRQLAPHAAPLCAALLALLWLNLAFGGEGVSLSHPDMRAAVAAIAIAKILVFLVYAAATLRLPLPFSGTPRRMKALRALRPIVALAIAAYIFQAASFLAFLARLSWAPDSDPIGGLVLAALIYAIGYFCFLNGDIFDLRDPYEAAPMAASEVEAIREQVHNHLGATEAYREPAFDLETLARAVLLPPGRLSQALNAGNGGGFTGIVNAYRLDAYLAARADSANRGRSALELALEAGFNSKATFYRTLRRSRR
jgi:AraC-like DNA-binding protein